MTGQVDTLVDCRAMAARLGISADYTLKLAAAGIIPRIKLGARTVRFDPVAVRRAIDRRSAVRAR